MFFVFWLNTESVPIFLNRPHARDRLHGVSEPMAVNPLASWLCQALGTAILPSVSLARYVLVRKADGNGAQDLPCQHE